MKIYLKNNRINIMEERRLELAFEGPRFWDIIRQGMAKADELTNWDSGNEYFDEAPYPWDFRTKTDFDLWIQLNR